MGYKATAGYATSASALKWRLLITRTTCQSLPVPKMKKTNIYTYIYIHIWLYKEMCVHLHMNICACLYINVFACSYIYVFACLYIYVCVLNL